MAALSVRTSSSVGHVADRPGRVLGRSNVGGSRIMRWSRAEKVAQEAASHASGSSRLPATVSQRPAQAAVACWRPHRRRLR
ncbi:hypothetical protein GW17_00037902 [Ensete ventricosum]|nr:hypothetical protein GW17_00037902 [Ensete ventricosum]